MFTNRPAVSAVEPVAVGARHWPVLTHEAEHVVGFESKRCACLGGRFEKHLGVVYADLLENELEVVVDVLYSHTLSL